MKSHLNLVLITFVFLECILLIGIVVLVCRWRINTNVLGVTRVVSMNNTNLLFSPEENLKYFYEPNPESVETHEPEWSSLPITYTINADSLNDRYNYSAEKTPNVFRIITLGDSFTYGQYVDTKDSWPEQLEDILNNGNCNKDIKFQVINLGVFGYDVQYISHRYALRGIKYHPDLIIWFESGSGLDRSLELMHEFIDMSKNKLTDEERKAYKVKGNYTPSLSLALDEVKKTYGEVHISSLVGSWWSNFFRIRGDTPVLVTAYQNTSLQHREKLQSWTRNQPNLGLAFVISTFEENGKLPDGHPNTYGHKIIALDTLTHLVQAQIIPCTSIP